MTQMSMYHSDEEDDIPLQDLRLQLARGEDEITSGKEGTVK